MTAEVIALIKLRYLYCFPQGVDAIQPTLSWLAEMIRVFFKGLEVYV